MYSRGDIVLVAFPFTNLEGEKVRPALVLSRKEAGDDVTLCFISPVVSKGVRATELLLAKDGKNFKQTGLKVDSIIKVTKIATLERKSILGRLGCLGREDFSNVQKIIKNYFGV